MDELSAKLTISHLRLAVAIAEENSLVRAAKRLNMTQPAVTKALQVAEGQLDVPLFTRTSAGMVPTLYGDALVAQARLVLSQLGRAAQNIGDLRDGMIGRLVVGTLPAPSAVLLPAAIMALHEEQRNLVVEVVEGANDTLIPALARGDLDLVVGTLSPTIDRSLLVQEELFSEQLTIVARPDHPFVGRKDAALADLVGAKWILPSQSTSLRRQIDAAFRLEGVEPPIASVETRALLLIQSLLLQSDYLTAMPWQMVAWGVKEKRLGVVPVSLAFTEAAVGITSRVDLPPSPITARFVEALRKVSSALHRPPELSTPSQHP